MICAGERRTEDSVSVSGRDQPHPKMLSILKLDGCIRHMLMFCRDAYRAQATASLAGRIKDLG